MADQCTQNSALLDELWVRSFSYLDQNDLFVLGCVSRNFLSMSSTDSLWEAHCRRRWKGKQNTDRFICKEEVGVGANDGRVEYCADLIEQFLHPTLVPALNMGFLIHEPKSWKEAYIMAEMDSQRTNLAREELIYFKWQLIYNGSPSQMGLRQFQENGRYWSPYMGMCEWILRDPIPGQIGGQHLLFGGMTLLVERDLNWGWIIGRDERTVYHSVETGDNV